MKIITKYKEYLKLLESKKSDDFLRNYRNGLDFYLTEEDYEFVDVNIEQYELILKRLKMSNKFLNYNDGKSHGKKYTTTSLNFNLFLMFSSPKYLFICIFVHIARHFPNKRRWFEG